MEQGALARAGQARGPAPIEGRHEARADDPVPARVHWQRAVELFERLGDTTAVEELTHDLADLPGPATDGEPDNASDDEA